MSHDIKNLEPKALWENFYALTQIPRPSKKEQKAAEFVIDFAKKNNLEWLQDEVGNVIVRKPATKGMENRKGVILQGHVDMVPQKNSDKKHDFETDPIETRIVDGWVLANGTTLGADNGIGAASMLAVLQSNTLEHGPLECLFTIDEETGMTGAFGLKPGLLNGDILINTDSEDEGELYVGCAGGTDANVKFFYTQVPVSQGVEAFRLALTGLKGGHSGLDIPLGRGNANKLLFRFLRHVVAQYGARLASIEGGSLRNAIPREAFAVITVPTNEAEAFLDAVDEFEEIYKAELAKTEPNLHFVAEKTGMPSFLIDEMTQDDLINAIQACPNGVVRMSDSMAGLVETSLNLAIIKSDDKNIFVHCLIRSSVDTAKEDVESTVESVFRMAGAEVWFTGQYPGWRPNLDSQILKTMQMVYEGMYGKVPEIRAIHAGLECGILGSSYPHWEMISFGPTIRFPHSPDEKVNIETVQKFWDFMVETLKNIPVK